VAGSTETALPDRPPYPQVCATRTEPEVFVATPAVGKTSRACGPRLALGFASMAPELLRKNIVSTQFRSVAFWSRSTVVWVPELLKRGTV
jgi:hypothetical protein